MAVHWTREKLDVDVGLLFASGCALGATVSISCALVLSQPFDFPSINFPRPYRRSESPSLIVMLTFWPFGVIPTSTLLLLISSPLRLSGLKPTPSELLRHSAVCYLEHVALLLCTVYAERRHELEEGRRSAAGAPFDFPISKEWRNGYDHIADHYLDYSASWRRLLWTRALVLGRDASRATSRSCQPSEHAKRISEFQPPGFGPTKGPVPKTLSRIRFLSSPDRSRS
jgi:hypothetical protein